MVQQLPPLLPHPPQQGGVGKEAAGPDGHHFQLENWGSLVRPPDNGTHTESLCTPQVNRVLEFDSPETAMGLTGQGMGNYYRADIPCFDGDNPKWWKRNCEKYFKISQTQQSLWKDLATMNFTGHASLWLQSVEEKVEKLNWQEFCDALCEKFGKNHYKVLIRKLRNVKQMGTVLEYVENFNNLIHQMLAHNPIIDQDIFTTAFIDGLKSEIRVVVIIQMSEDLDAASSLALLQEEVMEGMKYQEVGRDQRRRDPSNWAKSYVSGAVQGPVQANFQSGLKSNSRTAHEDRRGTEEAQA
jgi:hypothetical protein